MHVLEMYVFFEIMQILAFDTEFANNGSAPSQIEKIHIKSLLSNNYYKPQLT